MEVVIETGFFYLGKECVQAMNFLALLNERIILGNSFQRQLLHQINLIRIIYVFPLFHKRDELGLSTNQATF